MPHASPSTSGTTAPTDIATDGSASFASAQARRLSSEQPPVMPCLFGGSSKTIAAKSESTAPYSETKARTYRPSLSDRLTQSLISSGLVRGITPMSTRKKSGQPILVFAFCDLGGVDSALPAAASSSLSAHLDPTPTKGGE